MADGATVRAAGGIVVRRGPAGPEIALVHRARYGDWTLPKGKLEPGEGEDEAAVREVEEETGLRCRPVRFVDRIGYVDSRGRDKTVAYWLMEIVDGELGPHNEVDETRWATLPEALGTLSYARDADLLRRCLGEAVAAGLDGGSGA